jgi:NDP-sugar pyrophosphorylase family protein
VVNSLDAGFDIGSPSAADAPTLVVMAAGIGSRYGGLKQVDAIGPHGESILEYSIYDALLAGFGSVVFVIKEDIEQAFRQAVGQKVEAQCQTSYVFQKIKDLPQGFHVPPARHKPWGTAQAVLSCRHAVHTPFAVINADDFYGRSSFQLLCNYLRTVAGPERAYDYCMIGYVLENTLSDHGHVARGVCSVDDDGFLVNIEELKQIERFGAIARNRGNGETWAEIPITSVVSMNMWGFTPSLFDELGTRFPYFFQRNSDKLDAAEYLLPEVVGDLIEERVVQVKVLPTAEKWLGITYRQDKPRVQRALRDLTHQGLYPDNLWGQVR